MKNNYTSQYYKPPVYLPATWWDAVAPLADWFKDELRRAYDLGYTDGLKEAKIQRMLDDSDRRNRLSCLHRMSEISH